MTNRHKFRAWDVLRKEWVDDLFISHDGLAYQLLENRWISLHLHNYKIVQSISLNGKEMWEGDIVASECGDSVFDHVGVVSLTYMGILMTCKHTWYHVDRRSDKLNFKYVNQFFLKYNEINNPEIIGNKFQNPDLLEPSHE